MDKPPLRGALLATVAIAVSLIFAACSAAPRTVEEWSVETWIPLRLDVPQPRDATPDNCQSALVKIRDQIQPDSAAPDPELQEAFEKWSEAAQSLTFECASKAEDFSYVESYAEVERLGAQVDRILEDTT